MCPVKNLGDIAKWYDPDFSQVHVIYSENTSCIVGYCGKADGSVCVAVLLVHADCGV